MSLPKSVELQWQNEVIERWLNTPGLPSDAREGLLEAQRNVKAEMEKLEKSRTLMGPEMVLLYHAYTQRKTRRIPRRLHDLQKGGRRCSSRMT